MNSAHPPSTPAAPVAETPTPYVLMKRGLFYRPNAAGYTADILEAGRYTESEAKKHVNPHDEPVTMRLFSSFPAGKLETDLAARDAELARLRELNEQWKANHRDALDHYNKGREDIDDLRAQLQTATERAERAERELAEAKAERDALKRELAKRIEDYLGERFCCSGLDCGCQGVTRLQQYLQEEAGTQIAERDRLRALAGELAGALDSIPPCDVSGDARFVYKAESWKWAEAMERRNVALALRLPNPASGAAITPAIHRKAP